MQIHLKGDNKIHCKHCCQNFASKKAMKSHLENCKITRNIKKPNIFSTINEIARVKIFDNAVTVVKNNNNSRHHVKELETCQNTENPTLPPSEKNKIVIDTRCTVRLTRLVLKKRKPIFAVTRNKTGKEVINGGLSVEANVDSEDGRQNDPSVLKDRGGIVCCKKEVISREPPIEVTSSVADDSSGDEIEVVAIKPVCPVCKMKFNTEQILARHVIVHLHDNKEYELRVGYDES